MRADRLADLVADREQRVQRGHRVLQDHRDPPAAHLLHLLIGFLQQILALEHHPAADDARGGRQHAHDGESEGALAGAGFADDAQRLAGMDAQRHVIDRPHDAGALGRDVVGRKVLQL